MAKSAVSNHFAEQFNAIQLSQEVKDKIVQKIQGQSEPVLEMLRSKEFQKRSISPIIKKFQQAEINAKEKKNLISQQRLKEAERLKKELQEKLDAVNNSIGLIKDDQHQIIPNKISNEDRILRIKETRKQFMNRNDLETKEKLEKEAQEQAKR